MDTNAEIRRRRLVELCNQEGGVRVVADKAKMNWQALDQIIKKVLLPQKADGTRSPRTLGDDTARKLEEVFDLGRGWFDWPFEHVDFRLWESLDENQRAAVQGRLDAAMREVLQKKRPKVLEALNRTAVSDKKVEKHFKPLPSGAAEAARRTASTTAATRPARDPRERELPLHDDQDD
jgi:hypothetical protein